MNLFFESTQISWLAKALLKPSYCMEPCGTHLNPSSIGNVRSQVIHSQNSLASPWQLVSNTPTIVHQNYFSIQKTSNNLIAFKRKAPSMDCISLNALVNHYLFPSACNKLGGIFYFQTQIQISYSWLKMYISH